MKKLKRTEAVLAVLKEKGAPATIKTIERLLPSYLRVCISSYRATAKSCSQLCKKGKLRKWGGRPEKTLIMYGLPGHTRPPVLVPTASEKMRKWANGEFN